MANMCAMRSYNEVKIYFENKKLLNFLYRNMKFPILKLRYLKLLQIDLNIKT